MICHIQNNAAAEILASFWKRPLLRLRDGIEGQIGGSCSAGRREPAVLDNLTDRADPFAVRLAACERS